MTETLSLTDFREAVQRTVDAGGARITLHLDHSRVHDAVDALPRRRGIFNALGKALFRRLPRSMDADGFLDLAGRRAMYDQGHYARVQLDDQEWGGRPGRTLGSLSTGTAPWYSSPLSLFDALTGATALEDHGVDDDPSRPWRHVTTTTDVSGTEEKIHVWLDDRRVRMLQLGRNTTSMTFDEFGVDVDELDWTRLPSHRGSATS